VIAVVLVLLAAAVLGAPRRRSSRTDARDPGTAGPAGSARRSSPLQADDEPDAAQVGRRDTRRAVGAVVALGVAAVAGLGPVMGAVTAAVACPVAFVAVRALARRPASTRPDRALALTLDLCAAALRAGRTMPDALTAAAEAAERSSRAALIRVAGLLRLGADPERAWAVLDPRGPLGPVAVVAARGASSGIRSAAAFERLAEEIRADCASAASTRAARAGVLGIAPLGACFLPSFVCLGIVPVVVGIAGSALAGLH
jgi:Flp pilus assembly protein TadB